MTDLLKLAERVEAGDWDEWPISKALGYKYIASGLGDAKNGSLDAAKALHEAVLPEVSFYTLLAKILHEHTDGELEGNGLPRYVVGAILREKAHDQ